MNTETGQIYRDREVLEARMRGEPIVELNEQQVAHLEPLSKEERRRAWREKWGTVAT